MVKCELCGRKVRTTFLGKLIGTVVYDAKKKKRYICKDCQKENTLEEIKEKL